MLNLHEISIFIAAADQGTFSEAGRTMQLSQPAVNQAIRNLERQFGAPLFVRHGRVVRLSEAGEALLPLAREVIGASQRLMDTMNNMQGPVMGELNIGCSSAAGKLLLPGLVAAFRREYPQVRARIGIYSRQEVFDRLLDGQVALGVTSKLMEHHELEYQPFFDDRVILVASAAHPWAAAGRVMPADLLDQPLITREPDAGTTEVALAGLAPYGITPEMLDVVMEVGSAEAISMAVEEGIGLAFVSELAAARGLALGRLQKVEVEGLDLRRTIYVGRNLRLSLTRAQERLWTFIRDRRSEMAARYLAAAAGQGPAAPAAEA